MYSNPQQMQSWMATATPLQQQQMMMYMQQQQQSQWMQPQQPKVQQPPGLSAGSALPAGWSAHIDPSSQHTYYYNSTTQEMTWNHPGHSATSAAQPAPAQAVSKPPVLKPAPSYSSAVYSAYSAPNSSMGNSSATPMTPQTAGQLALERALAMRAAGQNSLGGGGSSNDGGDSGRGRERGGRSRGGRGDKKSREDREFNDISNLPDDDHSNAPAAVTAWRTENVMRTCGGCVDPWHDFSIFSPLLFLVEILCNLLSLCFCMTHQVDLCDMPLPPRNSPKLHASRLQSAVCHSSAGLAERYGGTIGVIRVDTSTS